MLSDKFCTDFNFQFWRRVPQGLILMWPMWPSFKLFCILVCGVLGGNLAVDDARLHCTGGKGQYAVVKLCSKFHSTGQMIILHYLSAGQQLHMVHSWFPQHSLNSFWSQKELICKKANHAKFKTVWKLANSIIKTGLHPHHKWDSTWTLMILHLNSGPAWSM